jgi:hypothetical protein
MYQALIGSRNFFGLFSERVAKRVRYKEFREILRMRKNWTGGGQTAWRKEGTRISMTMLLRRRSGCGGQLFQFFVRKVDARGVPAFGSVTQPKHPRKPSQLRKRKAKQNSGAVFVYSRLRIMVSHLHASFLPGLDRRSQWQFLNQAARKNKLFGMSRLSVL